MLKIDLVPMDRSSVSPCQLLVQTDDWSFALVLHQVLGMRCKFPDDKYAESSFGNLPLETAQRLLKNLVEAVNGQEAKNG